MVSSAGGVTRLRKISDLRKTLEDTNSAFDAAMEMASNREGPQSKLSPRDGYDINIRIISEIRILSG